MRRINSEFKTANMSEEGHKLSNRDYFGYVEMDDFACYVLADSLDEEPAVNGAHLVAESLIRSFTERPAIGKRRLKSYLEQAHNCLLYTSSVSYIQCGGNDREFHRLPADSVQCELW